MINKNCPCKRKKCERHGNCIECRKHHAKSKRQIPVACEQKKKCMKSCSKDQIPVCKKGK